MVSENQREQISPELSTAPRLSQNGLKVNKKDSKIEELNKFANNCLYMSGMGTYTNILAT